MWYIEKEIPSNVNPDWGGPFVWAQGPGNLRLVKKRVTGSISLGPFKIELDPWQKKSTFRLYDNRKNIS